MSTLLHVLLALAVLALVLGWVRVPWANPPRSRPEPSARLYVAPLGADPTDPASWTDLGPAHFEEQR